MEKLPHSKSCFVCGSQNRSGLKLQFETNGSEVRTTWVPRPDYAGFQQVIHGGVVATLLDEIMVWACGVRTGKFTYCAELTVRYNLPVRPEQPVTATAELVEDKRRLFLARGEIRNAAGELLASATGKYVPVKDMDYSALVSDFEAPVEELRKLFPGAY